MVLTTYLDSADESDPIGPTQLDILVVVPDFTTGSCINCFRLVAPTIPSGSVRIVAFFCFRASCFRSTFGVLWRSEINHRNLAVSCTSKLDSQFLSTSLWRVVPSIGTLVGLTLFGCCMFSLFAIAGVACLLQLVVWFRGSESVLFGSYVVAGSKLLSSSGRLCLDLPRRPTLRTVRILECWPSWSCIFSNLWGNYLAPILFLVVGFGRL